MRILHYFLGFPPYRSGGLTRYAHDLMIAQKQDGHCLMAMWPGRMTVINKKLHIKNVKLISGIESYEIVNPLPVPLDEGIIDIDSFMQKGDIKVYRDFLSQKKPDAIHIHTLMGLHAEFVQAAKELGIRTVFTTHDYFGICPKVTLYKYGQVCMDESGCEDCLQCNLNALSIKKIMLMQSPLYRLLKNSRVIRYLRKRHRQEFFEEKAIPEIPLDLVTNDYAERYRNLRKFYCAIFESIDVIHFNSTIAQQIYKKYITPKKEIVMSITHRNILDCRNIREWNWTGKLRLTLLAPAKPFKGFNILKQALDELWKEGKRDFELNIYSPVKDLAEYMNVYEDGFQQNQLVNIFAQTDILVAPSVWYETFGFTVLEAISYGVPVILSDRVGAKDIVGSGGFVVPAGDVDALKCAIANMNESTIKAFKTEICQLDGIKTWDVFVKENYRLYYK